MIMRESDLQVALNTWGPIKMTIDKQTQESWGKISQDSLRKVFMTFQQKRVPTKAHSQRDDANEATSACG
jgi:hypothetical protein